MSDQLILDDGALATAASHFRDAALQMKHSNMRAPLGEVRGLTGLEQRFTEFLRGVAAAKRTMGEAAHSGGLAVASWMADSSDIDAEISGALGRTVRASGHG